MLPGLIDRGFLDWLIGFFFPAGVWPPAKRDEVVSDALRWR